MNRADAIDRWRRIANGDLRRVQDQYDPLDLIGWIEEVATAVLEADQQQSPSQRPYDLTNAIGLQGRLNSHLELRRFLEIWIEFDDVKPLVRGDATGRLVAIGRQFFPEGLDDDDVLRRVNGVLKTIREAK